MLSAYDTGMFGGFCLKQYGRTVNFAGECALLLFHRDPDLAVVVLVLGAVLKPAGVAIQLHIDACGDLVVGVRGQPLGEDLLSCKRSTMFLYR